jgi:predicted RNA-binding Zn-ribbon protein involved in translation (DUF1610 family)
VIGTAGSYRRFTRRSHLRLKQSPLSAPQGKHKYRLRACFSCGRMLFLGRTRMALIACQECGKSISDRAATCPSCGIPLPVQTSRSTTEERRVSPWALWALGITGVFFVVVVVGSLSQERKPAMDRLKEACAREFPGDSRLAANCVIKNAVDIIVDDRQQRMDRAGTTVR